MMANKRGGKAPKRKGSGYEREIVKQAQLVGLPANRMPLSGACVGYENDVKIGNIVIEAKRRSKPISKTLDDILNESIRRGGSAVVTRSDNGESRVYMNLDLFLGMYNIAWSLGEYHSRYTLNEFTAIHEEVKPNLEERLDGFIEAVRNDP